MVLFDAAFLLVAFEVVVVVAVVCHDDVLSEAVAVDVTVEEALCCTMTL